MRKILALLVALVLMLPLAMPAAFAEASEQKLVFALESDPDSLDPGFTNNSFASPFFANTFESLVRYDETGKIVPGAAEKWDISADGCTYTFTLREGLKWSDGSQLTTDDFLYSWKRVLTASFASRYPHMLYDFIKGAREYYDGTGTEEDLGIKKIDERTLSITLIAPTPYFLQIMNIWVYNPVKQSVVEADPTGWAGNAAGYPSNGPFYLTKVALGDSYILTKNPNYWNAANVKLEQITFRMIAEPSTQLLAVESGEIDGCRSIPPSDIPRLMAESDAFQVVPAFAHTWYQFNNQRVPFNDVRVRKAFALAIDREEIIQNVVQSPAIPATGYIPEGFVTTEGDFRKMGDTYGLTAKANIEEAQKLLAEAGFPNGEGFPKLTLSYYTSPTVKKIAEALQAMWKQNLNVDLDITTTEWKVYYEGVKRLEYDVCAMGAGGDYLHPMTFFSSNVSDSQDNSIGYASPAYDELYAKVKVTVDEAESVKLMHELEDIYMNDMPIIPLYYRSNTLMLHPYVKGWSMDALNNLSFAGAYIEK